MKVEIYDPAMCCSSGMCGPGIDPALVKMNKAVLALQKQGVEVLRFNLAQQHVIKEAGKLIDSPKRYMFLRDNEVKGIERLRAVSMETGAR